MKMGEGTASIFNYKRDILAEIRPSDHRPRAANSGAPTYLGIFASFRQEDMSAARQTIGYNQPTLPGLYLGAVVKIPSH
jgi:hypothetical protein